MTIIKAEPEIFYGYTIPIVGEFYDNAQKVLFTKTSKMRSIAIAGIANVVHVKPVKNNFYKVTASDGRTYTVKVLQPGEYIE